MTRDVAYPSDEDVARACRAIMEDAFDPAGPGAAVVVARSGTPVFRAGFGMASLELGVRIEPEMVLPVRCIQKPAMTRSPRRGTSSLATFPNNLRPSAATPG